MKKLLIMLAAISFLYGCTTFGNFANLKQNKSTKDDVKSSLGEPLEKRIEEDQEVWQYRFIKENLEAPSGKQTVLNLDINFKDKAVDNYNITVTQEALPEVREPEGLPAPPYQRPPQPDQRGEGFINKFDRNNDGRVSREEFPAPENVFRNLDRNHDGFIDPSEAPKGSPRRRRK